MKHTLALLIALLPATAMATGVNQKVDIDVHTYSKATASAQAKAQASAFGLGVGYGGAGGNATGGNATGGDTTVNTESAHHPVSSAIAPSVSNAITCPIATQESKAISLLFISGSGTTGVMFHGLCYALERGDYATADAMMCEADKAYAKANPDCKK